MPGREPIEITLNRLEQRIKSVKEQLNELTPAFLRQYAALKNEKDKKDSEENYLTRKDALEAEKYQLESQFRKLTGSHQDSDINEPKIGADSQKSNHKTSHVVTTTKKNISRVNKGDKDGKTAVFRACEKGNGMLLSQLLRRKDVDVNIPDNEGVTPLLMACQKGYDDMVELLLQKDGIDLEIFSKLRMNPLLTACKLGSPRLVEMLIKAGADVNCFVGDRTPLIEAINNKKVNTVVDALLKSGKLDVDIETSDGKTPIFAACASGNVKLVSMLREAETKLINNNYYGMTPLLLACEKGDIEMVQELLLFKGIGINQPNSDGETPLLLAVRSRNEKLVQVLIKAGADVNKPSKFKTTPLLEACRLYDKASILALLDAKANVNLVDQDRKSPLYFAAIDGDQEIVERLIDEGADVNHRDGFGDAPLHNASAYNHVAAVQTLLTSPNIDVNILDSTGRTPIMLACVDNKPAIVKLLINAKANLNKPDKKNRTPLYFSTYKKNTSIMRLLINAGETLSKKELANLEEADKLPRLKEEEKKVYLYNQVLSSCTKLKDNKQVSRKLKSKKNTDLSRSLSHQLAELMNSTRQSDSNKEILDLLHENNTDPNTRFTNSLGRRVTVLMQACYDGNVELVTNLLEMEDLDINALDDLQENALTYALNSGGKSAKLVKILLQKNIKMTKRSTAVLSQSHATKTTESKRTPSTTNSSRK